MAIESAPNNFNGSHLKLGFLVISHSVSNHGPASQFISRALAFRGARVRVLARRVLQLTQTWLSGVNLSIPCIIFTISFFFLSFLFHFSPFALSFILNLLLLLLFNLFI